MFLFVDSLHSFLVDYSTHNTNDFAIVSKQELLARPRAIHIIWSKTDQHILGHLKYILAKSFVFDVGEEMVSMCVM